MVTNPVQKMKAGLKEKVTRPFYVSRVFRQDLPTRRHLSTELKGEKEGDHCYVGKCVPSRGSNLYQELKEELQGISDLLKGNIRACDGP